MGEQSYMLAAAAQAEINISTAIKDICRVVGAPVEPVSSNQAFMANQGVDDSMSAPRRGCGGAGGGSAPATPRRRHLEATPQGGTGVSPVAKRPNVYVAPEVRAEAQAAATLQELTGEVLNVKDTIAAMRVWARPAQLNWQSPTASTRAPIRADSTPRRRGPCRYRLSAQRCRSAPYPFPPAAAARNPQPPPPAGPRRLGKCQQSETHTHTHTHTRWSPCGGLEWWSEFAPNNRPE